MESATQEKKKLGIKDFALMGIFEAVMFALAMVLMMVTGVTPVVYLFYPAVFAFASGPLFMLVAVKVRTFGAFLVPSAVMGVLLGLMGAQTLLITVIVFGLIAEAIANSGSYRDFKRIAIAYVVLMLGYYAGDTAPIYVFTDWYIQQATGGAAGVDMTYLNELIGTAKSWLGIASVIACVVGAAAGVVVGRKILRKHFVKAGLV